MFPGGGIYSQLRTTIITQWNKCHQHLHNADEKTETQGCERTCPQSNSWQMVTLGHELATYHHLFFFFAKVAPSPSTSTISQGLPPAAGHGCAARLSSSPHWAVPGAWRSCNSRPWAEAAPGCSPPSPPAAVGSAPEPAAVPAAAAPALPAPPLAPGLEPAAVAPAAAGSFEPPAAAVPLSSETGSGPQAPPHLPGTGDRNVK